jgi:hypothetical protein
MEELQEVRQMVMRQMETNGFVRPTLFLVGSKSRLGYTLTSLPDNLDEATSLMPSLGKQLAAEHLEVGKLVRAYLAIIGLITFPSDDRASREVLLIHGVETATNEQQAVVYEVLRDRTQHSMPFTALQEFASKDPIPEQPVLQAFVDGYLSFD